MQLFIQTPVFTCVIRLHLFFMILLPSSEDKGCRTTHYIAITHADAVRASPLGFEATTNKADPCLDRILFALHNSFLLTMSEILEAFALCNFSSVNLRIVHTV